MPLVNFQEAVKQLGPNDIERGQVIGVSERTVRLWRAKELRILQIIVAHPELAHALAKDAGICCKAIEPAQNTP